MSRLIDHSGQTFGLWTVLEHAGNGYWRCRCACGCQSIVRGFYLRDGQSRSCGCLRPELSRERMFIHGHSPRGGHSRTYRSWQAMRTRCDNKNRPGYDNYGGRGITICERLAKFESFLAHLGERPPGMSIDRIDNEGNYSCGACPECQEQGWPNNVRWATWVQQNNNRRPWSQTTARVATAA
jgi:hypothetical protein